MARKRSAPAAASCARRRSAGTRFSPKEMVADLRIPPQSRHGGSSSPARTRSMVSSIGPCHPHRDALRLAQVAVDLDDLLRRVAGEMVEPVDVLRHQGVERGTPLELGEREVPGVRLARSAPHVAVDARLPRALAVLGVGDVVLDRGAPLGGRVLGPDALRAAEVGDARGGGDAGAGEHDDALRVAYELGDRRDVGHARDASEERAARPRGGRAARRRPVGWETGRISARAGGARQRGRAHRDDGRTPSGRCRDRPSGGTPSRAARARHGRDRRLARAV